MPGWPDYTILREGKMLLIEFKVSTNTLSDIQKEVIAMLLKEGFTVLVLRTYADAVDATMKFFSV